MEFSWSSRRASWLTAVGYQSSSYQPRSMSQRHGSRARMRFYVSLKTSPQSPKRSLESCGLLNAKALEPSRVQAIGWFTKEIDLRCTVQPAVHLLAGTFVGG